MGRTVVVHANSVTDRAYDRISPCLHMLMQISGSAPILLSVIPILALIDWSMLLLIPLPCFGISYAGTTKPAAGTTKPAAGTTKASVVTNGGGQNKEIVVRNNFITQRENALWLWTGHVPGPYTHIECHHSQFNEY